MDYIQHFQTVIDYIDYHIDEVITIEQLAEIAAYSPFHFSRKFRELLGESPMDYVKKRKLQFALQDMAHGISANEVAFQYGYETYVGFAKAFKKTFGVSPSTYYIHCPKAPPPLIDIQKLQSYQTGGIIKQPKIEEKSAFWLVGKTYHNTVENIQRTKDAPSYWFHQGLTDGEIERDLYAHFAPRIHGEYCLNIRHGEALTNFIFFFGVHNEQEYKEVVEPFSSLSIPSATYAIFQTPPVCPANFVESITGTWLYILNYWLPSADYEIDEQAFDFEFYDERCHPWEYDKVMMEIYIPIKLKYD
ncbi:AraC family transcriptional regulator [Lysinibacillus piscis]|uniref:AraC family transcriptional regulator n=1 Tax=Lysinibacillus piscis TaxID=2518931 RepID=A0ABQ5NND8_9BACI|nr:AraC family transcriptional regulator [Lysinibacillus sp. KH24]GLC89601.1 AraC family transcriptional regulator [Lysinibacillus sp. KH24]